MERQIDRQIIAVLNPSQPLRLYDSVCVCVCVCVWRGAGGREGDRGKNGSYFIYLSATLLFYFSLSLFFRSFLLSFLFFFFFFFFFFHFFFSPVESTVFVCVLLLLLILGMGPPFVCITVSNKDLFNLTDMRFEGEH